MFRTKNLVRLSLITAALAAAPAAYADTTTAPTEAPALVQHQATPDHTQQQTPQAASHDDASRYAQRQQHDKSVENYQGGAVILISGGAVLVALILLILLL